MNIFRLILHKLAHWFGWNYGTIETWWEGETKMMVAFRCNCGKMQGVDEVPKHLYT